MARPNGNSRLKSARIAAGYNSQQALADALEEAAKTMGLREFQIGVRQVRRWESAAPPWPQAEQQSVLTHLLGQSMAELGFTAPWSGDGPQPRVPAPRTRDTGPLGTAAVPTTPTATRQPASVGADYAAVTAAHRRLYWSVAPAQLHPAVVQHARLGWHILPETAGHCRTTLASALAETLLLAGRIEFFDLRQPDTATETFVQALQAAAESQDAQLGAAILAHSAFVPGWDGRRDEAAERMVAARTYARRGNAGPEFLAWLDAVEAECETRCGHTGTALHLIGHAEDLLASGARESVPSWMDWFSSVRLAAFKGNTQLRAKHIPQARQTLLEVLDELPADADKQRTVVLGDLASVEAAASNPEQACDYASQALDQLATTWYATGMQRVRDVRRELAPWQHEQCVRDLDDRLYAWATTVSALQR